MAKGSKNHQYNTWWIKTPTKTEQKNHSFSEELQHLLYNSTLHCYRWLVNANISNWETYVVHVGFATIKDLVFFAEFCFFFPTVFCGFSYIWQEAEELYLCSYTLTIYIQQILWSPHYTIRCIQLIKYHFLV